MLQFVLRCARVPLSRAVSPMHAGKIMRHAMRRHWGLSHHAANIVVHGALGTMLVCVAVPVGLALMPPAAPPALPPSGIEAPPNAPPSAESEPIPPEVPFVPGLLFFPPHDVTDLSPPPDRIRREVLPEHSPVVVPEPPPPAVFAVGGVVLLMLSRRGR